MKLNATFRTQQGTGASRRLRRAGQVPGIVYGANQQAQAISLSHKDLWYSMQEEKFYSSILHLEIDGKTEPVLLRTHQNHPFKSQILHIDFQRVDPQVPVIVKVPLHFKGHTESPAVKKHGGQVSFVCNQIQITCMADKLPEFIEVDCSALDMSKRSIHASDLQFPEGVSIPNHGQSDLSIVTVKIKNAAAQAAGDE